MNSQYQRKVSPIERVFTLLHEIDTPFSVQVVLEGTGTLDESRWKKAVSAACEANPGSRLVFKGFSRWARWKDSDIAAPVKCIDGNGWSAYGPEGAPFLLDPFPFKKTHSCDVLLIPGNPPRVVFRALHATMDGKGALFWIEDIFRALRNEPLVGSPSTINDEEYVKLLKKPRKFVNLISYIPLPLMKIIFTRVRQRNLQSGLYYCTGSISNLGQLPIESFQGGGFKADTCFIIPPDMQGKAFFMILTGCGDFVEMIVSMPKTLATNGRLDQFMSNITSELKPKDASFAFRVPSDSPFEKDVHIGKVLLD